MEEGPWGSGLSLGQVRDVPFEFLMGRTCRRLPVEREEVEIDTPIAPSNESPSRATLQSRWEGPPR